MTTQEKIVKFEKVVDGIRTQITILQEMMREENTEKMRLMVVSTAKLAAAFDHEIERLKNIGG